MTDSSTGRLAVVGLGLMGSRMARHLLASGFELTGFDVDADRRAEAQRMGVEIAGSPGEAVQDCWGALLSLPNSDISREVCLGDGGLSTSGVEPLDVYDTTTGRPGDAVELATALAEVGINYADATVSGNGEIAEQGELVVMVGGDAESYESGIPVFEAIGRSHHYMGGPGSGSRMKLLVNHVLTIHRMALAEGLVVAELAGMDLDRTLAVLKDSLAYSKAMDSWGDRMIAGDHEIPFARVRQSAKDARLIVEQAESLGATADLARVVREALVEGESNGLADMDNGAIVEVVRRRSGIGRITP